MFQIESLKHYEIFEDYFTPNKLEQRRKHTPCRKVLPKDLLIEKAHHYCNVKRLTSNIAHMFTAKDPQLLQCKYLEIDKKLFPIDAHKKMLKFCKFVQN